jgi:hypothetical protein
MIQEASGRGVPIYVSDESSDAATEKIVRDLQGSYDNLHYRRMPQLGHDAHLPATLCWPGGDYVWLLGDGLRFERNTLASILDFLCDQDLIFVNAHAVKPESVKGASGDNALQLIRELVWHQTLTGATIYHRRVIDWMKQESPRIYRNFPQLSVILGYATARCATLAWYGDRVLISEPRTSYWRGYALDLFVDDWVTVIEGYPNIIPEREQRRVLRSHSANTGLFDRGFLLQLKDTGQLRWSSLKRRRFFDVMHLTRGEILALLAAPDVVIRLVRAAKGRLRGRKPRGANP